MAARRSGSVCYAVMELDGGRYAVLREAALLRLCRRAGVVAQAMAAGGAAPEAELDGAALARRLVERRRQARLTQAALARRAGVRVETLNRIERGRTTPDFATIRKLVVAMNAAEAEI